MATKRESIEFDRYLNQSFGNQIEAAKALMRALREERGIYLKMECLPKLFNIGETYTQQRGLRKNPILMRHYAVNEGLEHPEQVLDHLEVNGVTLDCSTYLTEHPITACCVDPGRTLDNLLKTNTLKKSEDPYEQARAYFRYLISNGISLTKSNLDEAISKKVLVQMQDPIRIVNLAIDSELYLRVCRRGVEQVHPSEDRILLRKGFVRDPTNYAETRDKEIGYGKITHGLCNECSDKLEEEIRKKHIKPSHPSQQQ